MFHIYIRSDSIYIFDQMNALQSEERGECVCVSEHVSESERHGEREIWREIDKESRRPCFSHAATSYYYDTKIK